jgi:hypothetical protein
MPVPEFVRGIERLEARSAALVESIAWIGKYAVQGKMTMSIIGLYIKVSWTNPDDKRESGLRGGIQLLPGTHRQPPDFPITTDDFICLGAGDSPPDQGFSAEDSLAQ